MANEQKFYNAPNDANEVVLNQISNRSHSLSFKIKYNKMVKSSNFNNDLLEISQERDVILSEVPFKDE